MPPAEVPSGGLVQRVWRFPFTQMLVGGLMLVVVASSCSIALRLLHLPRNSPLEALGGLVIAAAVVLTYKGYKRWVEQAPDSEFALRGAPGELGLGLLGGFGIFSLMAGVVWLLGGLQIEGVRGLGQLWSMLLMAFISGTFEEALFRGIVFRHVETMLGTWAALGITSALFGAAHLSNPDSSPLAALAIALEAGILLGAAYLYTRRLWLAVGIHAAWNFTQGWVFSVPVSGGDAPLGLLITRRAGPDWLTGGDFGLEASVIAMIVATAAGLFLLRAAIRRGELRAPMWRARVDSAD